MKKLNKMQKFLIASLSLFIGLAVVFGLSVNVLTTCAEDTQNSTESAEILDDSATDEEVVDGNEMDENDSVLDEETDETNATLDELKGMVQDYLDSRKDESGKVSLKAVLSDAKTWIVTALSFLGSTGLGAIILGIINRINKRKEILTDAQVESIATAAANKAVEKVVGKSIDVDISAEVSKAVKKELYSISNGVASLIDGVKNTEMLVASEAMALSHSRIIPGEEKRALLDNAKRAKAHAGKVVSAAKIEVALTEEPKPEKTESVEEKNMHYINFGGVEKK